MFLRGKIGCGGVPLIDRSAGGLRYFLIYAEKARFMMKVVTYQCFFFGDEITFKIYGDGFSPTVMPKSPDSRVWRKPAKRILEPGEILWIESDRLLWSGWFCCLLIALPSEKESQ